MIKVVGGSGWSTCWGGQSSQSRMVGSVRVIGLDVVVGVIIGLGFGVVRVVILDDEHSAQNIHGFNHQSI